MQTYQIRIIDPKAIKLLQDLAEMDLITIERKPSSSLKSVVDRLRKKAAVAQPSEEEITKEVELVRSKRYAKKKA